MPADFKIIGINDYLTIDGYKRIHEEKAKGRLANIECILPVVEFRVNRFAGENKLRRINYHVIFSDEVAAETIQTQFLGALSADYTLESGIVDADWSAIISDASFVELGQKIKKLAASDNSVQNKPDWQVGFDNFNVNYDKLKVILSRPQFKGKTITAIGKGEWDDFRWDAGGAADKRTLINEADIVFLSCNTVLQHETSKQNLTSQNVNNILLDCSDAHHFSSTEQKDKIGNCFTWLKIEPSFDGLRQILFEPKTRISISESHPNTKAPYQVIKSVRFVNGGSHFTDLTIFFSPYLNSIIGGKSTGKSLLAGLIVKSSDINEYKKRKVEQKNSVDELDWVKQKEGNVDFEVVWQDGAKTTLNDPSTTRKITYFPQHYLNSKINDKGAGNKELNKIIRVILSQTPLYAKAFEDYEESAQKIDASIAADCSDFENKIKELRQLKHTSQEKGKSADITANIEKLRGEFSDLKTQFGLSEDEIAQHQALAETIKTLTQNKEGTQANIDALSPITKYEIASKISTDILFDEEFSRLSNELIEKIRTKIAPLCMSFVDAVHGVIQEELKLERDILKLTDKQISDAGVSHAPILEKIKNSAPLREKSTLIKQEQEKLKEVIGIESKITSVQQEIDAISLRLKNYAKSKLESSKIVTSKIEQNPFSKDDDQLGIEITAKCKAEHIQGVLKDRIKYQSNSSIKTLLGEDDFSDTSIEGYSKRIETIVSQSVSGTIELKGDHKISGVLQELLSNATYLNYDLKLGDDSFVIMSPGKRALALLRVLVELDTSQHPIILDQPEDDLDNRSVYEGLAKYIKAKKLNRQIVVVTHNPNVVVGSDSEFVIVANQSGQESNQDNRNFRFEYVYGGLENSFIDQENSYVLEKQGIRQHVCEILDGGEIAFQRREQLYSGQKRKVAS